MPCIWHDLITLAIIYLLSASRSYSLFMLSVLFIVFMVSIEPRFRTCWCLYCLYSDYIVYRQGIDRSCRPVYGTHPYSCVDTLRQSPKRDTAVQEKYGLTAAFESHFQRYEKQKWESEPPPTHRPVWDKVSKVKSKVSRDWIFSTLKQATWWFAFRSCWFLKSCCLSLAWCVGLLAAWVGSRPVYTGRNDNDSHPWCSLCACTRGINKYKIGTLQDTPVNCTNSPSL